MDGSGPATPARAATEGAADVYTPPSETSLPLWRARMAWLLAWRNLAHDRSRFVVTLVGIVFAVVLIAMQVGLFLGFSDSTTVIIRHTRADFWIVAKGTQNFEVALPIDERELHIALSVPGVAHAERLLVQFYNWRKPGGGDESVLVVGFDLNTGLAGPWNLVAGKLEDLRRPDAAMVDRLFMGKLGIDGVGATVEINGRRTRVVGLTQGIRSFTTFPWVFCSLRTAQRAAGLGEDRSNYVIGTFAPGADPAQVRAALARALPRTDVYIGEALRRPHPGLLDAHHRGRGLGADLGGAGSAGRLVIVAQVLYATTMDHLTEFGTLRAMGAPTRLHLQGDPGPGGDQRHPGLSARDRHRAAVGQGERAGPRVVILVPLGAGRRTLWGDARDVHARLRGLDPQGHEYRPGHGLPAVTDHHREVGPRQALPVPTPPALEARSVSPWSTAAARPRCGPWTRWTSRSTPGRSWP
jgi:putative ABC transport system permease protein